jgi:hypothetical protein
MYKLTVLNKFGKISVMTSDNLEELKKVAKRLNANECDVEITKEEVLYRVVSLNK